MSGTKAAIKADALLVGRHSFTDSVSSAELHTEPKARPSIAFQNNSAIRIAHRKETVAMTQASLRVFFLPMDCFLLVYSWSSLSLLFPTLKQQSSTCLLAIISSRLISRSDEMEGRKRINSPQLSGPSTCLPASLEIAIRNIPDLLDMPRRLILYSSYRIQLLAASARYYSSDGDMSNV